MNSYSYVGWKRPRPGLPCLKWNQNLKSREFPSGPVVKIHALLKGAQI